MAFGSPLLVVTNQTLEGSPRYDSIYSPKVCVGASLVEKVASLTSRFT